MIDDPELNSAHSFTEGCDIDVDSRPKLSGKRLQVRHYAQIPCNPFCVDVKDETEAKKIIDTLANQHLFLFEQNIIPDYANSLVVVMWVDDGGDGYWTDYFNEQEQMEWEEFEETYLTAKA